MTKSLHALLEKLIDYAGLFPPAALSMQDAVRNYARYREGEHAWILGAFVVPKARVREVPSDFPLSVLGVDEVKFDEIADAAPHAFVEITDVALLPELKDRGLRAKIRTGGLTADAFPTTAAVANFIRGCKDAGVPFKATAGLHHPLRCVRPLTYEPNAPTGKMHGFINVFLGATLVDFADEILRETDPRSFFFGDDGASWRAHHVSVEAIAETRRTFALSFGSCSFEEPIADLQELGWL